MVGGFEAFGQGFASFFSIWQACIAQISPFFIAYVTALYFMAYKPPSKPSGPPSIAGRTVGPSLVYMVGFSVPYALQTVSGLPVGRFLAYNSGTLGFASGVFILLISLFIILHGRSSLVTKLDVPLHTIVMSLLLGAAFALVYSPCITPTLSKIMGIASRPQTAVEGGVLALYYGLGMSLAFAVTGAVLVALFSRVGVMTRNPGRVKDICGAVLGVLAVLNLSSLIIQPSLMIQYKAFVLGYFVR